jgi:hypothetical protein
MNETLEFALNKLTKWRSVFAGWQLGTRAKGDAESDAVKDHREVTILLRAEQNALLNILVRKGVLTYDEWEEQLLLEARHLDATYSQVFPGFFSEEYGMRLEMPAAAETMKKKNWRP